MSLDLGPAIRDALIDETAISNDLAQWSSEPCVFTRRPVPSGADFPMILINPPGSITDEDGLCSDRPVLAIDVAVYGIKAEPGDSTDQTRSVERIGFRIRDLFHRQKFSVIPEGFSVIDIRAAGPVPAPVDDEKTIGKLVALTVRLRRIS